MDADEQEARIDPNAKPSVTATDRESARKPSMRAYLAIFVLALAVRLAGTAVLVGYSTTPWAEPEPDALHYHTIAKNVVERGALEFEMNKMVYRSYRSPLWPLLLAGEYRVFGENYALVRVCQAILGSFLPLAVAALTALVFGSGEAALFAGLIAALYPFFVFYAALFLTDNLFLVLFAWTLVFLVRTLDDATTRSAWIAGLLLGLSALTRPVVYPFPVILAAGFVVAGRFDRHSWRKMGIVILAMVVVTAPWFVRNHGIHGAFIPGDTHGGNTFWGAYNPGLEKHPEFVGSWYVPTNDEVPERFRLDPSNLSELEQDRAYWRLGKMYALENPGFVAWSILVRVRRFFVFLPNGSLSRQAVSLLSFPPVLALALVGLFAWPVRRDHAAVLGLAFLSILVVCLLIVANARLRAPAEPILIAFAGAGAARLLGRKTEARA